MPKKFAGRLIVDGAMTILFLFALAYRITGDALHEWIGVAATVLFIVHNAINWRWYRVLFKGRYPVRRVLSTLVNLTLLAAMATLAVSGAFLSRAVLAFWNLPGGMFIRQVHATAAYWTWILIAVHLGMHWEMVAGVVRKMAGMRPGEREGRFWTIVSRTFAVLAIACGVAASFDRGMGGKLFRGFAFDFWDPARPTILFFAANMSIMGLYVAVTYYVLKWLESRRAEKKR